MFLPLPIEAGCESSARLVLLFVFIALQYCGNKPAKVHFVLPQQAFCCMRLLNVFPSPLCPPNSPFPQFATVLLMSPLPICQASPVGSPCQPVLCLWARVCILPGWIILLSSLVERAILFTCAVERMWRISRFSDSPNLCMWSQGVCFDVQFFIVKRRDGWRLPKRTVVFYFTSEFRAVGISV